MPDIEKVIKALQRDIRITERDPEMLRHVNSGRLCYFFEVKAVESAIALLKEQQKVIEQYHKADGFLDAHGWKWN